MEIEYLEENFEPKSVKVAQLRRILVENDVALSPGLKKAELCALFEQHIRPKRAELLREQSSEHVKDEIERATTDSSFSRDISSEDSAFSHVNDFQRKSNSSRKSSRKRKVEDTDPVSTDAPKTKKRGKRKMATPSWDSEEETSKPVGSPLVNKVRSKSPMKGSPHRSLIIDKFESSSSPSPVSTPGNVSSNADIWDFSVKRRTASPDFSKLKVSSEFAKQLAKASGNPSQTPLKAPVKESQRFSEDAESTENSFHDLPAFSHTQGNTLEEKPPSEGSTPSKGSSPSSTSKDSTPIKDNDSAAPEENVLNREDTSISEQNSDENSADIKEENETIESSEVEDNEESITLEDLDHEISEAKITTPELATADDVKRVEGMIESQSDGRSNVELGKRASLPRAPVRFVKKFSMGLWKLLFNIMIMVPILFGLWYREERLQIGYCGHEINLPTFDNANNKPWINNVERFLDQHKPKCLACPENAICYPYMKIKCKPDYVVTKSIWSLQGLFPISDYCTKDSRREKLISEVIAKSLELLRTKNGNIKCGEGQDDIESGITEADLYTIFYESRAPSINSEEFEELWSQVVEDLKNEPEITWRQLQTTRFDFGGDSDISVETNDLPEQERHFQLGGKNGIFRSSSKKYIGIRCKFEREVHQTYQKFKFVIWAVVGLLTIIKTLTHKMRAYYQRQEKIEQLTQQVIIKLQNTARASESSNSPAYLSTVQLRDVLLSDIVDLKLKNKLWKLVMKNLEQNNTNVKSTLMEVHGEIMKCWEWVGPSGG
ncbi:LADA_0G07932g1_1 [Lachancea dasiensis]|uniref:LADA_0G07932g1_1 n=1 Tax=Lachancea dasiensis TaxID=1072105 RepID=A0A1G4JTT6_9SACH|nr:LADA_0G07932g1_1 [Lachancea dasiensis]